MPDHARRLPCPNCNSLSGRVTWYQPSVGPAQFQSGECFNCCHVWHPVADDPPGLSGVVCGDPFA